MGRGGHPRRRLGHRDRGRPEESDLDPGAEATGHGDHDDLVTETEACLLEESDLEVEAEGAEAGGDASTQHEDTDGDTGEEKGE